MSETRKDYIILFVFGFIWGVVACMLLGEVFEDKLPEAITIEKEGKIVGYADTSPGLSEFVYVKDAKSPGMFLAFPIWAKNYIKQLNE